MQEDEGGDRRVVPKRRIVGIVSPPYTEANDRISKGKIQEGFVKDCLTRTYDRTNAGKSIENIGNLPDRQLVGIVSPPYEEAMGRKHHSPKADILMKEKRFETVYSKNKNNIGNLKDNSEPEDFDITQFHSCDEPLEWHGCYGSETAFKKYVTPASYAHPAKMSFLLCERIFKHLEKLGLLREGNVVCDFMAGSGRTNIIASLRGYDSVAVELEKHFCKMIENNITLTKKQINRKVDVKIIQGDSRRLSEILQERGLVGITSPPYFEQGKEPNPNDTTIGIKGRTYARNLYGKTNGNISLLPDKQLVGITSPPYENSDVDGARKMPDGYFDRIGGIGHTKTVGIQIGNPNNIGSQQSESYLSAMLQVYKEAAKVMPVLVTVTKNPTRRGKLRRLDLDTVKLLMMAGYRIVDYHRAVLFEEKKQATLTGGIKKDLRGRLSFFKRLSVQKGNVAAQWEDIIIAVRI